MEQIDGGWVSSILTLGTGVSQVIQIENNQLWLKSLKAGSGMTISVSDQEVTFASTGAGGGTITGGENVGVGEGVFKGVNGGLDKLQFRTLTAGAGTAFAGSTNEIQISSSVQGINIGSGVAVYDSVVSGDLRFKTLLAGDNITLYAPDANTIGIKSPTFLSDVGNTGPGDGQIFRSKVANVAFLKVLTAGAGVTLTPSADEIQISASGGSGTITDGENVGAGEGVFKGLNVGLDHLQFKSLTAGAGIILTPSANEIEIAASGFDPTANETITGSWQFNSGFGIASPGDMLIQSTTGSITLQGQTGVLVTSPTDITCTSSAGNVVLNGVNVDIGTSGPTSAINMGNPGSTFLATGVGVTLGSGVTTSMLIRGDSIQLGLVGNALTMNPNDIIASGTGGCDISYDNHIFLNSATNVSIGNNPGGFVQFGNLTGTTNVFGDVITVAGTSQITYDVNTINVAQFLDTVIKFPIYGAGTAVFLADGSLTSVSDKNKKELVKALAPAECLEAVAALKPVQFKFKEGTPERASDDGKFLGFFAQDVEMAHELLKEVVDVKDGKYSMGYHEVIAPLVGAVQALKAKVEELEKALKSKK